MVMRPGKKEKKFFLSSPQKGGEKGEANFLFSTRQKKGRGIKGKKKSLVLLIK